MNSPPANLTRQGTIVASMTLLSRISGFVRDVVLAYMFGATQYADMFFVALRVPNFFRRMFAEGAFSQAFVPVMVRYREDGLEALRGFLSPLSGIFGASLVLFVALGILGAPVLTALFAPGFYGDEPKFSQTVELVRITFPYLGFIALVSYSAAVLNAHNRFAIPAFTPVLLNLCLISCALLALGEQLDLYRGTVLLAWGVFIAGVVQLAFQIPAMARLRCLPRPDLNKTHPGVRQVGKLLVPALFSASVGQINALVNTMLASTLITGSITWLYFADRLMELPLGLAAVALGTVILPHLSRLASQEAHAKYSQTMDWGVLIGLTVGLPSAVALYLLAAPLSASVFLVVSGGAMSDLDIRMVALALEFFAVALPGFVLVKILAPGFFAHQNTQAPFKYASVAVAVNLVGSLATFSWFGHVGLALSTALSAWAHVILLLHGLRRAGHYKPGRQLGYRLVSVGLATLVLGLAVWHFLVPIAWFEMQGLERLLSMLGAIAAALLLYVLALFAFGIRIRHFVHRI
ncbi:MAG: murein biosynthesis integral membrane protein MurJ [Pseudomonadota bacterium]